MIEKVLQSAIAHRQELGFFSCGDWFVGIPIDIDLHWVRIVCSSCDEDIISAAWILQIDSISAIRIAETEWDFTPSQIDRDRPDEGIIKC
jgi:hypothetical protein